VLTRQLSGLPSGASPSAVAHEPGDNCDVGHVENDRRDHEEVVYRAENGSVDEIACRAAQHERGNPRRKIGSPHHQRRPESGGDESARGQAEHYGATRRRDAQAERVIVCGCDDTEATAIYERHGGELRRQIKCGDGGRAADNAICAPHM